MPFTPADNSSWAKCKTSGINQKRLKEVRLGVLTMGIKDILVYFELRASIKMIVTDITAVNTGQKNGVVVIRQRQQKLPVAQYVGCQNYVTHY